MSIAMDASRNPEKIGRGVNDRGGLLRIVVAFDEETLGRSRRRQTQQAALAEDRGGRTMSDEITETSQTVAAGQLRAMIERIERLEEEKRTIAEDIGQVYAEAKGNGFDTKAVRSIVKLRKKDQSERQEEEAILDLYKAALGMA